MLHFAYVMYFFHLVGMIQFSPVLFTIVYSIADAILMYKISEAKAAKAESEGTKNQKKRVPIKEFCFVFLLFVGEFLVFAIKYLRFTDAI